MPGTHQCICQMRGLENNVPDDGTMRKSNKADLAKRLEEQCDELPVLPQVSLVSSQPAAYLIDGMAMIPSLNDNHFKIFNDLGKLVLKRLVWIMDNKDMEPPVNVVTLVFDRYDKEHSIKSSERHRRGTTEGLLYQIKGSRDVPNFRRVLKSSANKASLAAFLSEYICENGQG